MRVCRRPPFRKTHLYHRLLGLLCKVAYSELNGTKVLDSLLWAFIAVFVGSSILYYLELKVTRPKTPQNISADIKTGTVTGSEIKGVSGTDPTSAKVKIATKDVKKSKIIGYEGKHNKH